MLSVQVLDFEDICLLIQHGRLDKARLYLGDTDTALDVYQTELGSIGVSTIGDLTKPGPNEDSAAIVPLNDSHLVLMVADGVGGLAGSRRASNLTVETVCRFLAEHPSDSERQLRTVILDGIEAANQAVLDTGTGGASTLALAEIGATHIRTYHVGDSVLLLCGQRGRVKLYTTPHSPVGFAMEAGLLDEREALEHSELNLIFNVIGSTDMRIEIGSEMPMAPRDSLLLATDGLMDNLMQDEIVNTIRIGKLGAALEDITTRSQKRMRNTDPEKPSKPDDFTAIVYRRKH